MTFLTTLIKFAILLIECFLCWIFSFTVGFMVISGLLAFLIEIISAEVNGLLIKGRRVLADQMEYLVAHFPRSSPLHERMQRWPM